MVIYLLNNFFSELYIFICFYFRCLYSTDHTLKCSKIKVFYREKEGKWQKMTMTKYFDNSVLLFIYLNYLFIYLFILQ